jgi:phosphoribosylanthranilate isomerase
MSVLIKICGMRESDNILSVAELKPDFMGFIFYPGSPRFAGDFLKPEILSSLPVGIRKTGVFVNAEFNDIIMSVGKYSLNAVQLHGDESPALCRRIKNYGIQVIKVFNISEKMSFAKCIDFIDCTDYFLFDTMTAKHGGSGQKFDWKLIEKYDTGIPFFLSGGLGPMDTDQINGITNPFFHGIDINSRFEIRPGLKDTQKLEHFINELRH